MDKSKIHLCLRPLWLVSFFVVPLLLFMVDLSEGGRIRISSWLALFVAATPPLGVLFTIAVLRCEASWKHYFRKIAFCCPKCARFGVPHFRCPHCSRLLKDLRPSTYGVFTAQCPCGVLLPTVDWFGRLDLQKVCPHCATDLVHEGFGGLPEYRIGIIGATSSGKSNLMVTAVWQLMQSFAPHNDVVIAFGNPVEELIYRQHVEGLEKGTVLQKTVSLPVPKAFTLSLHSPGGRGCILYLYDAAGEDYEEEHRISEHPLEKYDGIVLVVDPFAEEGARRGALGDIPAVDLQRANPAPVEITEILARLVSVHHFRNCDRKSRLS